MNFSEASHHAAVLEVLRSIEDKIYERGVLVTVTGDSESDVTISFKVVTTRGEEVPALMIAVTAVASRNLERADWESLSDYINDEYLQVRPLLGKEVLAGLDESCGQYVTLNGQVVY